VFELSHAYRRADKRQVSKKDRSRNCIFIQRYYSLNHYFSVGGLRNATARILVLFSDKASKSDGRN
jgi:hypothetical protein